MEKCVISEAMMEYR